MSTIGTETSFDIVIPVGESSFDLLIKSIQTPSRQSRSNSIQIQNDATSPSSASKHQTTNTGDYGNSTNSPTSSISKNGRNTTTIKINSLGRADPTNQSPHRSTRTGPPDWASRSRSGSIASSSSSDKLSHSGMLRHAVGRTTTIRQEQIRQFNATKSIESSQRPGCILSSNPEMMANLGGITPSGLPVWWCRYDNMVIFDGMLKNHETGDWIPMTRSSKGLPISNIKGHAETALMDVQCNHCKTLLDLHVWRYSTKVCERSVCAGCKVRCRQEYFRMMKEGHSFKHFEKVSGDLPVLARVPTPEPTSTSIQSQPAELTALVKECQPEFMPEAHKTVLAPDRELAPLEMNAAEVQPEFIESVTEFDKSLEQIDLEINLQPLPKRDSDVSAEQATQNDIDLAITSGPDTVDAIFDGNNPVKSSHIPSRLITDFMLPDMPQQRDVEPTQLACSDSPLSEHPQTPTLESIELVQLTEDLLSPGLKQASLDEEPFDISLYIKNLDTNEVTSLVVDC